MSNVAKWIRDHLFDIALIIVAASAIGGVFHLKGRLDELRPERIAEAQATQSAWMTDLFEAHYYMSSRNESEALLTIDRIETSDAGARIRYLAYELHCRLLTVSMGPTPEERRQPLAELQKIANKMIELEPTRYNGYHWKGIAHMFMAGLSRSNQEKELEAARVSFEKAVGAFDGQIKDLQNLLEISILLGKPETAQEEARSLRERRPRLSKVDDLVLVFLLALAEVLDTTDANPSYSDAMTKLENFNEIDPDIYVTSELEDYVKTSALVSERQRELADALIRRMKQITQ